MKSNLYALFCEYESNQKKNSVQNITTNQSVLKYDYSRKKNRMYFEGIFTKSTSYTFI